MISYLSVCSAGLSAPGRKLPVLGYICLFLALSGAIRATDDRAAASRSRRRFDVEGGKLDVAFDILSAQLQLTGPQRTQVRALMAQRAHSFQAQYADNLDLLRGKVDQLLTPAQKERHHWSDAEWGRSDGEGPLARWDVDKWLSAFKDLPPEQIIELKSLIQHRDTAIRQTLVSVEKIYEDALALVLTPNQRATLARLEAEDPAIHIPTDR